MLSASSIINNIFNDSVTVSKSTSPVHDETSQCVTLDSDRSFGEPETEGFGGGNESIGSLNFPLLHPRYWPCCDFKDGGVSSLHT